MTRGQKIAATRKRNAELRAQEARHQRFADRAHRAWETRRANLHAKGLLGPDGEPTRKLERARRVTALKGWATRRFNEDMEARA